VRNPAPELETTIAAARLRRRLGITQNTSMEKDQLLKRLRHVRHLSVVATRQGDVREVARLTREAAKINEQLSRSERPEA
jgi:hypothetical protein